MNIDEQTYKILSRLADARVPLELIYAFLKTGMLPAQEARQHMPEEDRAEFDAAVAEYLAQKDRR